MGAGGSKRGIGGGDGVGVPVATAAARATAVVQTARHITGQQSSHRSFASAVRSASTGLTLARSSASRLF